MIRRFVAGQLALVCLTLGAAAPMQAEDTIAPAVVSLTATAAEAKPTPPPTGGDRQPIDVAIATDEHVIVLRLLVKRGGGDYIARWQKYVEEQFAKADADQDGALSAEEMRSIRPLLAAVPQVRRARQVVLNGMVVNEDANQLASDPPVDSSRQLSPGATLAQFVDFVRGGVNTPVRIEGSVAVNAESKALFTHLDTDHDGTLSMSECARAYDVLHRLDYHNVELIGRSQLQLDDNQLTPNGRVRQQNVPTRMALKLLSQGGLGTALSWAEKLRAHFAASGKDESQQARNVPRLALLYDEQTFSPIDADGDGQLDQEELAHAMRRPLPHVEVAVDTDGREGMLQTSVVHLDSAVGHLDDPTTHPTLVAGRERIELSSGSFEAAGNENTRVRNRFMRADEDMNEYLDKNEIQRFGLEGIEALDADGDGKLYLKEITEYLDAAAEMAEHRLLVTVADRGHGLFEALDTDHDEQLSHRELVQMAKSAKQWDLNADGQLSLEEVPHLYSLQIAQQPVPLPFNNNFFQPVRGRFANGRALRGAPPWFATMDRNNDGDLSAQEFLGTPAQFRRFDADSNGLIDSQEANAEITPAETKTAVAEKTPPITAPPSGDAAEGEEPISLP